MRAVILSAVLASLLPARARAQDANAVGWTSDGKLFVVAVHDAIGSPDIGNYQLYDARTGIPQGDGVPVPDFALWKKDHPLAPLTAGAKSADGKRELVASSGGDWKGSRFIVAGGTAKMMGDPDPTYTQPRIPPPTKINFSVKSGSTTTLARELKFEHLNVQQEVEAVFSPDGKRVALLIHDVGIGAGPSDSYELDFGPTAGPRVELLAPRGSPEEAFTTNAAKLEAAGLVPVATDTSQSVHPKTVVYAAPGFDAEAKKAAAALGATVEPLTWKPGFDLVVALGAK
ncbi:MAG: hypothetical protein JST54_24880 [Deltaproteobacteria bacterium]|nr:hypothetical protein [Deltaproteobacteria bacterium]